MKLILLSTLAIFLAVGIASAPPPVFSDDDEITVGAHRAESQFPDGIRFFIEANGPDEIDDVRVFFKKLGQTSRSSYRTIEFTPGTSIAGEVIIPSRKGGQYIPPGTRIEYSFEIRDTTGRKLRTEDQVFIYLDQAFEWGEVSQGMITVFYNYEGISDRAQEIVDVAQETLDRMGPILGVEPQHPLHIVAYTRYRDMVKVLPPTSQTVREQLITQGLAFTNERVLLVLAGSGGYLGTAQHEFVHLLVADAAGRGDDVVPFWLNEGLAEYNNTRPSDDYDGALAGAIADGTVKPLWHLQGRVGNPHDLIVAYGQGKSVVNYLISTYGPEKMAALFPALEETFDIDAALLMVYGFDQWGLDAEWREHQGLPPLPPPEEKVTSAPEPVPTVRPLDIKPQSTQPKAPAEQESTEKRPAAGEPESSRETPQAVGCGAPVSQGLTKADPAMLILFMLPLGLLWVRRSRQR